MATLKLQQIPQLTALLPYIDLVPNQEYLICRIRGWHTVMSSSSGRKYDSVRFYLHSVPGFFNSNIELSAHVYSSNAC